MMSQRLVSNNVMAFHVSDLSLVFRNLANMGKSRSLDTDNPPDSGTLVKNCLEGDLSHSEKARDLELNKVLL